LETILSIGIDIGTSTTSLVMSRFLFENTASQFTIPRISIIEKKVMYRSKIYFTPFRSDGLIDIEKLKEILSIEYKLAGITPKDIETGAVIITGESARKENAELVTETMSKLAGDFVVASAGPDLESIIAGKGSGAFQFSIDNHCSIANLDIGGGTTNIALFESGEIIAKGCFNIGGRLITYDNDQKVTYISPQLKPVIEALGVPIRLAAKISGENIEKICDAMTDVLLSVVTGNNSKFSTFLETKESTQIKLESMPDYVCFSGGVGEAIYTPGESPYQYNDIGIFLARSISKSKLFTDFKKYKAKEAIRATVIGAGTYTTTVSGSTISFSEDMIFPLKNLPVFVVEEAIEKECAEGVAAAYKKECKWFLEQTNAKKILFCFRKIRNPSYNEVSNIAKVLAETAENFLEEHIPLLVLTENDFAKSLGQVLHRFAGKAAPLAKAGRKIVCIDGIKANSNDYVDIGKPLMNGIAIPVVVKTLVFERSESRDVLARS